MNTRTTVNLPAPRATWMPRRVRSTRTPLDLLLALAVAAALFLFL